MHNNKKRLNIAILVDRLSNGGAERIAGLLSVALSSNGYGVYLFIPVDGEIIYNHKGEIVRLKQGDIYDDIRRKKQEYEIDCAISFMKSMNLANVRTKGNESVILSYRASEDIMGSPLPLINKYYKDADAIVTCSHGVRELLIRNGELCSTNIIAVNNFLNLKEIKELSNTELPDNVNKFLNGANYVLTVGRLVPVKNQKYLIRQFSYYHYHYDDKTKLLIIGSGELYEELIHEIEANKMQDFIRIENYTTNPFVFYRHAEAFLLTSLNEGIPNVILEAMAFRLPTVSVDCYTGPRELLNDETSYEEETKGYKVVKRGILVEQEKNNTHYFADGLNRLIYDRELAEGIRKNVDIYIKGYSNTDILRQWESVINDSIENRKDSLGLIIREKEEYEEICKAESIIVYGTGYYGKKVMLKLLNQGREAFYAVTGSPQLDYIDGIPVKSIEDCKSLKNKAIVLLASVRDGYVMTMMDYLKAMGFSKVFFPTI